MAERDSEIERICQAALDCPPEARDALLSAECGGDVSLRRDVEDLLAFERTADRFLEPQALQVPSRLGPYEITSLLGIGGMGEVYRARDTVLGRDVALKMLPRGFAADPDRVARLQREARALAALNHPNIAQIYGLEQGALVMELVHGETLKTPRPMAEALDYASQIASALEAAHERAVVHRDVKPGNIMTTAEGVVKVLDFGLAATGDDAAPERPEQNDGASPGHATRAGALMGTASYMSPEQASGKPVDKRTDIWSFGVVLWEMVTGKRLFEGETTDGTLHLVRTAPIQWGALPHHTPPAVRELLVRCLDRDPRTRLRDIGEARIQLQRATATPPPAAFPTVRLVRAGAWVSATLAVLFAGLFLNERRAARRAQRPPLTFHVAAPAGTTLTSGPTISPDGRSVAFTGMGTDGRVRIWVHALDSAQARPLPGTEDPFSPLFWSPDSRYVGFATGTALKKAAVAGGLPITLCNRCGPTAIGSRVFRGGAWNAAGVIVYAISSDGLWRVSDTGGIPARVTTRGDYGYPHFLPDGQRLLFTWFGGNPQPGVYLADIRQREPQPSNRLVDGGFVVSAYVPRAGAGAGYLLTLREGVLTARTFDPTAAVVSGEPVTLAEDVPTVDPPAAFSASTTGTLAFSSSTASDRTQLVWVDRRGRVVSTLGPSSYGSSVSISADGAHVAFDTIEPDRRTRHIWSADPARGVATLLKAGARDWTPAAAPGGDVAFTSAGQIYLTRPSAVGSPEALYRSEYPKLANDWSPDRRYLSFNELHPTERANLYVLDMASRKPIPLVTTDADELPAIFSPDGKWIAYSSDETGTREIYVRDFAPDRVPAVGTLRIRVSTNGGDKPRWRRDGSELYYLAPDGRLMAAPVKRAPRFDVGLPVPLFEVRVPKASFSPYDVARDGRFLVAARENAAVGEAGRMTIVANWTDR